MDTSNSAKISVSDLEEIRQQNKTARCIQHSLSKAMAEALYQPHTMVQPKPLASRVKDAGKEFLRHNQTCQWIQFIQDPPVPMERRREKRPTPVKTMPSREINPLPIKEVEVIIPPPSVEPPPFMQPSPPSFEDQLQSLHKQQEELLEQQHQLENQMEQKKTRQMLSLHDLQPKPAVSETPEVESASTVSPVRQRSEGLGAVNYPPTRFRRRLKGSIAQSYAERDEGSIGSLLFNTTGQQRPTERKSEISSASYRRYARPNLDGRHYATWQESSSSISQLLSQNPGSSSCDSESSATLLTELTIDERKSGHGDF
ncbi:hypothetical protein BsWGS_21480 [Bradybaena similaris]